MKYKCPRNTQIIFINNNLICVSVTNIKQPFQGNNTTGKELVSTINTDRRACMKVPGEIKPYFISHTYTAEFKTLIPIGQSQTHAQVSNSK